jgi:hypothetical protein
VIYKSPKRSTTTATTANPKPPRKRLNTSGLHQYLSATKENIAHLERKRG